MPSKRQRHTYISHTGNMVEMRHFMDLVSDRTLETIA